MKKKSIISFLYPQGDICFIRIPFWADIKGLTKASSLAFVGVVRTFLWEGLKQKRQTLHFSEEVEFLSVFLYQMHAWYKLVTMFNIYDRMDRFDHIDKDKEIKPQRLYGVPVLERETPKSSWCCLSTLWMSMTVYFSTRAAEVISAAGEKMWARQCRMVMKSTFRGQRWLVKLTNKLTWIGWGFR